jgi:hypothetical protein
MIIKGKGGEEYRTEASNQCDSCEDIKKTF